MAEFDELSLKSQIRNNKEEEEEPYYASDRSILKNAK